MKSNCYDNRELSWLKFNKRVLQLAGNKNIPLCERMSFAGIFESNLDEFYRVRVGSLYDQTFLKKMKKDNKTGMTAKEQLSYIFAETKTLQKVKDKIYKNLMNEVKNEGVQIITFQDISKEDCRYLEKYYKRSIKPLLSPQVIGKKSPFPFLSNQQIYAVAVLQTKNTEKLCIVPCSNGVFERLISIPSDKQKYMLVEELILHFMSDIFEKYTIKSKSLIRIIRNADIDIDEDFYDNDGSYRESMETLLKVRKKLCPVKMDYYRPMDEKVIKSLCRELDLKKEQVFYSESPLELSFVYKLKDGLRSKKELFYPRMIPKVPMDINENTSMIQRIEQGDMLLQYPYDSIYPFMKMLKEAVYDSRVVSIKITLYRVAKNSRIVETLIEAAENGKEVVVMIELRARFDEKNNLEWSRRMEEAGCRIVYGIDFVKVHSKICLITYSEDGVVKHISQIGTGNYNENTAKIYTDLSLITADNEIAQEVAMTFNKICMGQFVENTKHLLVAPKSMQDKVLEMIDTEIIKVQKGKTGYIGLKMNSLTDKKIIDKLIEASKAGVKIDMVVRGICCLIAGVKGETENITVRSIVGRFLEHSRIYIFGERDDERIYISSADFMTRNMLRRIEVAVPIYDNKIKERIWEMFHKLLNDNVNALEMKADGSYEKVVCHGEEVNSQQ
ncbi:MAG: polyphosphate kinase 1 [Eubacterium sp.]|nr:polyphosphate kinase 1 [Eubacterium sp.]